MFSIGEGAGLDGFGPKTARQEQPRQAQKGLRRQDTNAQDINDWLRKAVYGLFRLAVA